MSYRTLVRRIRAGRVVRVWHGVYALTQPEVLQRLAALDLVTGRSIVACMNTAAYLYGCDTEADSRVHILDPGVRMRPSADLMVHQRIGAPLQEDSWSAGNRAGVDGRRSRAHTTSTPCAGRSRRRANSEQCCTSTDLRAAIDEQKGRRGIVKVRELMSMRTAGLSRPWKARRGWCSSMADCRCRNCSSRSSTAAENFGGSISRGRRRWWPPNTRAWSGTPVLRR